ncbi:MAG: site-2 protease family protein, partial [Candidatus Moranbacteria bacterium]|nr:site-2 protease family protein [Candidatus Moranbacteria bacterium]
MITAIIFIIILGVLIFAHELGHFLTARRNGIKAYEFGFGFPPRIIGFQRLTGKKIEKVSEQEEIKTEISEEAVSKNIEVVKEVITDKIREIDEITPVKRWRFIFGRHDGDDPQEKKDLDEAHEKKYIGGTIYSLNLIPIGGFVKIKGENGDQKDDSDSFAGKSVWVRIKVLIAGVLMNFVLAWVLISLVLMIGAPEMVESGSQEANKKIQIMAVAPESPAERMGLNVGDEIINIQGL